MASIDTDRLRARYLKLRGQHPDMSNSALAGKLGISPTTLRKYRAEWDSDSTPVAEPEQPAAAERPLGGAPELTGSEGRPPADAHRGISLLGRHEFAPERPIAAVAKQIRKAQEPEPQGPPRDKRFSEAHPGAWNLARNLLPRLQVLVPMLILCYSALTETMRGNYGFYNDWAKALKLPQIMAVMSSPETIVDTLLANNGYYIWILVIIVIAVVLFYEFVWKSAFKEYNKKVYMREYKEGRCYWHEGNWWHRAWDRYYRSPPRETVRFYIRTHWWPPLNIFNPRASMIEVTISKEEKYNTRGNKLVVEEKPIRELVDHNRMVTRDGNYQGAPVPVDDARQELDSRQSELIKGTQKVTMANPHIRKETLRKSGIVASPEFIEEVRKAKEEKAGGA